MENRIRLQAEIAEEITTLQRNYSKDSLPRKTKSYLESRITKVKALYVKYLSGDEEIRAADPPLDSDHPYLKRRKEVSENYETLIADMRRRLNAGPPLTPTISTADISQPPPFDIPGFGAKTHAPSNNNDEAEPKLGTGDEPQQHSSLHGNERGTSDGHDIRQLLKKQDVLMRQLYKKIVSIDYALEMEEVTKEYVQLKVHQLQKGVDQIDELHTTIMVESEEGDRTDNYFINNYHDTLQDKVETTIIRLQQAQIAAKEVLTRCTKLPKVEIPTFSGDYEQWNSFNDIFTEVIHRNKQISDTVKMTYLKSHVQKSAAQLIRHLSTTGENYRAAWDLLQSRFENPRLLASKYFNTLLSLPSIQIATAGAIRNHHDTAKEMLHNIERLQMSVPFESFVAFILLKKLDPDTARLYETALAKPREVQNIKEYFEFMERRFQSLEAMGSTKPTTVKASPLTTPPLNRVVAATSINKCLVKPCRENHRLDQCSQFREMSTLDRARLVNESGLCVRCLSQTHKRGDCRAAVCIVCKGQHHTLLHCNNAATTSMSTAQTFLVNQQGPVLLPTALIKATTSNGQIILLRALIDSGSQATLISSKAANLLNIRRRKTHVNISGIGGSNAGICRQTINVEIAPRFFGDFRLNIDALIFDKLAQQLPETNINVDKWKHLHNIQLADPQYNMSQPIDLVIGADYYPLLLTNDILKGERHEPMAQRTEFGWTIIGNLGAPADHTITSMVTTKAIEEQLKLFIENDNIPEERSRTEEEIKIESHFKSTVGRCPDGRYMVRIPFKTNNMNLGESRRTAVARLLQLERKFDKDASFKQTYHQFMQEYIDLKHMKIISTESERVKVSESYYIPHHGVIKQDSTTTKLRVVFDASAKTTTGVSLNDLMMTGPKLQEDLVDILLRWRSHKFVITADIEKMYRQIWIHKRDRDFQRILWRNDPTKPMATYRLNTVTYGTTAASFLAVRALLKLAEDNSSIYPTAAKILSSDFYVDDLLTGGDSKAEIILATNQLRILTELGGMTLRKWASNSADVLDHIPSELHRTGNLSIKLNDSVKTLGIIYHPLVDVFKFDVSELHLSECHPTKRSLLSDSSKLFDPIGWLAPITITAKLMMQEAWRIGIDWDESLPATLNTSWIRYKEEMSIMTEIAIPRWIGTTRASSVELHGFADASEMAYAAVVYCRTIDSMGNITTNLLMSKTRVAPIKTKLPIPRLELNAALLLAKLMQHVQSAMGLNNVKTYAWSDSTITLCWIKGEPNRYKTFVANRISAINSMLPITTWNHVKSSDNPADIASRGTTPLALANNHLWWKGPDFLQNKVIPDAPTQENLVVLEPNDLEEKVVQAFIAVKEANPFAALFKRHSNINKLKRIIAYCKRFINRNKLTNQWNEVPSNQELQDAEITILRIMQEQDFHDEVLCLKFARKINNKSRLASLNPMRGDDGLLRVNGRLQNADLPATSRYPIILDSHNIITLRIIEETHRNTMHGGTQLTLAQLRNKYWVIDGKRAVRNVVQKCLKCFRHKQHISDQLMGILPAARVQPGRAFAKTGIDYAGPIQLRTTRGRGHKSYKGYIALFICMVTKAIHIEIVSCLTTESFIAAYKRFVSRRGLCTDIYSDNGTYFVGADAVLKKNHHTAIKSLPNDIAAMIAVDGTNWHFIPPHAPHFGGIWEAGIKSVKFHLKRVVGESTLTFEELYTVTSQIEACLNSRPLIALSNDPSDLRALTPGHFLIGDSLKAPPSASIEAMGLNSRWLMLEHMVQQYWKRWSSEYIHQLQQRYKWKNVQPNLKVHDLVLLKDDQLPATRWKLGRVLEVHAGRDDLVRVATIKCQDATYKRPIVKLCKLPIEEELSDAAPIRYIDNGSASSNGAGPRQEKVSNALSSSNNAAPRQQPHRRAKLGRANQVALAIFSFCCLLGFAQSNIRITPFNKSTGIHFEELGKLEIVAMRWTLVVHYNLSSYWDEIENFKQAHTELTTACAELKLSCNIMLQQLLWQYNNLIADNALLFESNQDRRRVKRGFGDTVGLVLGDMFGVLSQREAEIYEAQFEAIGNNENHLLTLVKNQTSVIDNTVRLVRHNSNLTITAINNLIKEQHRLRQDMLLLQEYRTYEDRVRSVFINLIEMTLVLRSLEDTQQGLLDVVHHVHQGLLHPSILTPTQLEKELQVIRQHVPTTVTLPGHNIHGLRHVYQSMTVRSRVTQKYVIIEIIIPLSFAWDYTLIAIIPVPDIAHGNTQSHIVTSTDYLAMDNRREHFALMTKEDVNRCHMFQHTQFLCEVSPIISLNDPNQCEIAILQRKDGLDTTCDIGTINATNHWIKLHVPNQWIYVIPNETTVDVTCGSRIQPYIFRGSGIVEIEAGCLLRDANIQIIAIGTAQRSINKTLYKTAHLMHGAHNLHNLVTSINKNRTHNDLNLLTTPETTELENQLDELREKEVLPIHQNIHHVHHYTMIHVIFWSCIAIGITWVICKIRRRRITNRPPSPLPGSADSIV